MAILNPEVDNPFQAIKKEQASEAIATGLYADDPALSLVVQNAVMAETFQQTKAWVTGVTSAATLYQSPFTPQYWEGTQLARAAVPFFTVATAVNSLNPQIMKGLFSGATWFEIEPRPGTRKQAARAVGDLIVYQMEDIGFAEQIRLGAFNALLYGTGIWKYGWETFTRKRKVYKRKNPPMVLPNPMGVPGAPNISIHETEEDFEEETLTEYIDRPRFENVTNLREVLVAPTLEVPDIQKARYVIHRKYLTFEDLDRLRDQPGFKIPAKDKLLSLFFSPKEEAVGAPQELNARNPLWDARAQERWKEDSADPLQQPLEVLEYWDKDKVIMVLQRKLVICNDENVYGEIPFFSVGWWDVPEAFWSMGLGRTVGSEQRLQQGITNTWLDGTALNLSGVYVRVKGKSIPTQSIRIAPGKIVEVDNQKDFMPLERLPAVPEAGQHLALSQQRTEQVSGSSEMGTQGIAGASGHSNAARSATGVNLMAGGTGARIEEFVDKLSRQVIERFLYAAHEMNRTMLPLSTIRYILNDELQHAYMQDDKGDMLEILNARMKFSILAASKMAARRTMAQAYPVLTQFITNQQIENQLQIQAKKVDVTEWLRIGFELSDFPAYNDVIVDMKPDEIQRMQARTPAAAAQTQIAGKSTLLNQEYDRKEQLADEENIARAARDVGREEFKKATEPLQLTGEADATSGFGSTES